MISECRLVCCSVLTVLLLELANYAMLAYQLYMHRSHFAHN